MHSPPIGNFESFLSRIQSPALRLVAQHWNEARGVKKMPSWADLSLSTLSPDPKRLWGFAFDPKTGDFTGRLAGGRLGKWVGDDFYGGRLADLHAPVNFGDAQQLLTRLVTVPLAVRSSGRLFTVGSITVTGERIALPMSDNGHTGDGILGASDYLPPPLLGPTELVHENVEWYAI